MRVLISSVTNRGPEVVGPHVKALKALEVPEGVEISYAYISDNAPKETLEILASLGGRVADALPKPPEAVYAPNEDTHAWNEATFDWLAREKQRLLDLAVEEDFDAIFLVDSDLVLGPETLASLISCEKDVVSAVFWTRWVPDAPPMPQVWLQHPYGMEGRSGARFMRDHEFLRRLDHHELVEVMGLGACTLIKTDVLRRGVGFFPRLAGLPSGGMWQGEDRTFCIKAQRAHVALWADAWPDIHHLYRPSDVEAFHLEGWTPTKRALRARVGDFVSFTLQALEEMEVVRMDRKEHVRGRLGALKLLPEIEHAILSMDAGTSRIVKVTFPEWWEAGPFTPLLRGKTRSVLVKVLDVKAGS